MCHHKINFIEYQKYHTNNSQIHSDKKGMKRCSKSQTCWVSRIQTKSEEFKQTETPTCSNPTELRI